MRGGGGVRGGREERATHERGLHISRPPILLKLGVFIRVPFLFVFYLPRYASTIFKTIFR